MAQAKGISEQAEELEFRQMQELGELMIYRSQINKLADGEWDDSPEFTAAEAVMMGEDRVWRTFEKPTLVDFFNLRFGPSKQHLCKAPR